MCHFFPSFFLNSYCLPSNVATQNDYKHISLRFLPPTQHSEGEWNVVCDLTFKSKFFLVFLIMFCPTLVFLVFYDKMRLSQVEKNSFKLTKVKCVIQGPIQAGSKYFTSHVFSGIRFPGGSHLPTFG